MPVGLSHCGSPTTDALQQPYNEEPTKPPPPFRFTEKGEEEPASETKTEKAKRCLARAGMQNGISNSQGHAYSVARRPTPAKNNPCSPLLPSPAGPKACRHPRMQRAQSSSDRPHPLQSLFQPNYHHIILELQILNSVKNKGRLNLGNVVLF